MPAPKSVLGKGGSDLSKPGVGREGSGFGIKRSKREGGAAASGLEGCSATIFRSGMVYRPRVVIWCLFGCGKGNFSRLKHRMGIWPGCTTCARNLCP